MRFKVLSNLLVVAMRNFPHNTSIKYTSRLCPLQDQARRVAVGRPYVRFPRFPMAISAVLSSSLGARWTVLFISTSLHLVGIATASGSVAIANQAAKKAPLTCRSVFEAPSVGDMMPRPPVKAP